MADDDVTQRFTADAEGYIGPVREAAASAQELADRDLAAKASVDSLRDSMAEAAVFAERMGAEMRTAGLEADEAAIAGAVAMDEYRDKLAEVAAMAELAERAIDGVRDAETEAGVAALLAGAETESSAFDFERSTVLMTAGVIALAAAAAPLIAGFAAAGAAIGAFGVLALPVIQKLDAALTGTGKATGPILQAADAIRQFKTEFQGLSQESGIGRDFLGDIPEALSTADRLLEQMIPLAQAGARSFREIEDALQGAVNSSGFTQLIDTLARYAPEATAAIINLAGALGGDIGSALEELAPQAASFTNTLASLVTELRGPLGAALVDGATAVQGLAKGFDEVSAPFDQMIGLFHTGASAANVFSNAIAKTVEVASGPVGMAVELGRDLKNLISPLHQASSGSDQLGSASRTLGSGMSVAESDAASLKDAVSALSSAFSKSLDPAAQADQAAITYRNDLATLNTDLKSSHDQIGLNSSSMRDSFSAYVSVANDAKAYSQQLLNVNHNAGGARAALENAITALEATGVHSQEAERLIEGLKAALASIPRHIESDITIATHYVSYGYGSTGGGTYGHKPIPGNEQFIGAGAGPGGGSGPVNINVKVDLAHTMSTPHAQQALAGHVHDAILDFASRNAGSFLVLPGKAG